METLDQKEFEIGVKHRAEGSCRFRVWAPLADKVEVCLNRRSYHPLESRDRGYYELVAEARPGCDYSYRLDGQAEFADPASEFQPQGVFGPSRVVDPHFPWTDHDW